MALSVVKSNSIPRSHRRAERLMPRQTIPPCLERCCLVEGNPRREERQQRKYLAN